MWLVATTLDNTGKKSYLVRSTSIYTITFNFQVSRTSNIYPVYR